MRSTFLMFALGLGMTAAVAQAAPPATELASHGDALGTYLVKFEEPAAASFRGFPVSEKRRPSLAATSPVATGERKYDSRSTDAVAYVGYLADLRRLRLNDASEQLGRPLSPLYVYSHAINGVALRLSPAEAEQLAKMPGVAAVSPDQQRELHTDKGPQWINADDIWNGAVPGVGAHRGEGVIVGVIDSGINRTHSAFSGAGITNPLGGFLGYCATNASACNSKLIGLWDFTVPGAGNTTDPTDEDGHGTHTASTAVGSPFGNFSGVAPRANLIAYKACADECSVSMLVAAIDRAVQDGVDVINYSIGSPPQDPWLYFAVSQVDDAEAFLGAREAGIVVAASAGNSGPTPGTHGNPSNSPWVLSVAAATHDRNGVNDADRLASFSSRGPVVPYSVVKPSLSAPGVNIIAAGLGSANSISQKSGTSMAAPHAAGAAALLKSVNPAYTADQITSALMLTARPSVKIFATVAGTPHDQGSGMTDVAAAARAGLYLEVPAGAFRIARSDLYTGAAEGLNLPSLGHGACFETCSLTRSFKLMPGAAPANYSIQTSLTAGATVTPSVGAFTSSAAGTTVTFNFNVSAPTLIGKWVYGSVTLVNNSGDGRPNLRLPVALYVAPYSDEADAVERIQINAPLERGFHDVSFSSLVPMQDPRFVATGLVTPQVQVRNITADPTQLEPYDNVASNFSGTIVVPASPPSGAVPYRIHASTSAPNDDIDLFVGRDDNGNGQPDKDEQLCSSQSGGSSELCDFGTTTGGGPVTYWYMVQNWAGPGTNVRIKTAAVSLADTSGNTLRATGPGRLAANAAFKVRLSWDDATLLNGGSRLGYLRLQPVPGVSAVDIPVEIDRTSAGFAPFALSPGAARAVTLPAGATHDTLYFDVPAHATSVTFRTQGSGSVSLYAARIDTPAGPVVAPAPARNAPGVQSSTGAGANQTIPVAGANLGGRWYVTPVNTGGGTAQVDVSATINTVNGTLAAKPGSYYNAARGGHGVFFYPSGPDLALLWYTYFQDGTPTWYYVQGAQPGSSGVFNGTIFRSAWNGTGNSLTRVGNLLITPSTDNTFAMSYNLDGFTGAESLQAFLTGCPMVSGTPLRVSTHWYDAAKPGYGYSTQVNPNYEFHSVFAYDGLGVPRFLVAERGGAFNAGGAPLPLAQLSGFSPLGAYSAPTRSTIGTLTRTYGSSTIISMSSAGTFVNGVPGTWSETGNMTALSTPQTCDP